MTEGERTTLIDLLEKSVANLGEHFDAVQVLVSTCDHEGTWTIARGYGNFNARQGMAHSFIKQDEAYDAAKFIANEIKLLDD